MKHKRHKDGRHILAELSKDELHAIRDGLWYRRAAVRASKERYLNDVSDEYVAQIVSECDRLMRIIPE